MRRQGAAVGLGAWAGSLGRGGCRLCVVLSTCCPPCSNVSSTESGPAVDNNAESASGSGESLSAKTAGRLATSSDAHDVERASAGFSRSVVGGAEMSCSAAGLSRSSRDTPMASSLVVESMVRTYTSWERLTGVRRG